MKSNPQTFNYCCKSGEYTFTADAGVFSSTKMDQNTDILLKNIPQLKGSLLDMGCGFGCIGIVLAKEYGLVLTQSDINPKAVRLTEENCKANGVESTVLVSDGYDKIQGKFDTIVINPPIHAGKAVMYKLYEGAFDRLDKDGRLYIVILKKHGAESTMAKLQEFFGNCTVIYKKKGCYVLCCTKN